MGISSSIYALADVIDPRQSYWTIEMTSGKRWSEHQLVGTWKHGQRGFRKLDWGEDIVTSGDVHRIKELTLHCPNGKLAVLEMTEPGESRAKYPAFQFKTKSVHILGGPGGQLEYQVIGRVIDKVNGWAECWIWDYRPLNGQPNLVAYQTNINHFGAWRDNITPLGALSVDVQGFRL